MTIDDCGFWIVGNQEPKTRNQKPETKNQKPETKNQTSRPEEGAEHIVAYNIEHLTRRHFLHGDLVGLGIFTMSRLQDNKHAWAADLIQRCGLRYRVPDAAPGEVRQCLDTLRAFKENAGLSYSIVDTREITEAFIEETLAALYEK